MSVAQDKSATHTPGPWLYDNKSGYYSRAGRVVRHNGVITALIPAPTVGCEVNETEANAHLIAAAPDLLAALKDAVRAIRIWHGMMMGDPYEAQAWALYQASPEMQRINAAIAKAEGR